MSGSRSARRAAKARRRLRTAQEIPRWNTEPRQSEYERAAQFQQLPYRPPGEARQARSRGSYSIGRLIVDDLTEARTMTPEQAQAARDWYERALPGSRDGVVAQGQVRVQGPLTGMSIGGYVKENAVSKHQDQAVEFLHRLERYLAGNGWDRMHHMLCSFDPTDGTWTLSLRVEDGDLPQAYEGIITNAPRVGEMVMVSTDGTAVWCPEADPRAIGRVQTLNEDGTINVVLGDSANHGVAFLDTYQNRAQEGPTAPWLRTVAGPGQFHHIGARLAEGATVPITRSEGLERMATLYAQMARAARERGE